MKQEQVLTKTLTYILDMREIIIAIKGSQSRNHNWTLLWGIHLLTISRP